MYHGSSLLQTYGGVHSPKNLLDKPKGSITNMCVQILHPAVEEDESCSSGRARRMCVSRGVVWDGVSPKPGGSVDQGGSAVKKEAVKGFY